MPKPNLVFCCRQSRNAARAFKQYGFSITPSPYEADLLWIRKGYQSLFYELQPFQALNHFVNESILINKGNLTATLKKYEANRLDRSLSMHDFYPETYCLANTAEQQQFQHRQPPRDDPNNIWIYKPGGRSCGRGIHITHRVRSIIDNDFTLPGTEPDPTRVIQRYIQNPLLIGKRKFDIRVYWLLASIEPLRVLVYPEAKIRLAGCVYQNQHLDNPLIHMTNYYQQKRHPRFDANLRYKWFLWELDNHLAATGQVDNQQGQRYSTDHLMPAIRRCLAHVVRAGQAGLRRDYPANGDTFGVYGADFLVDDQHAIHLTEIQKGPGLRIDDPVEQHIIPHMLGQAATIVMECRQARIMGYNDYTPNNIGQYEWVINDHNELATQVGVG